MIKTVIIDDEPLVRTLIRDILKIQCPEVSVEGEAGGITSGLRIIRQVQPDLVFLDVKIEEGTGFDLLQHYEGPPFKLIFITAFEEFAIKAFKMSAVDYLLKPVSPEELKNAVDKAERFLASDHETILRTLVSNIRNNFREDKKIILKTHEKYHFVFINQVLYCESDSSYTKFYLRDGTTILVSKTLKEYEDLLMEYGFFRTQKSFLINLKYIKAFEKANGGFIVMENDSRIPLSDKKKEEFLKLLEKL
jgi:two-component system, LytTR family, response regulator